MAELTCVASSYYYQVTKHGNEAKQSSTIWRRIFILTLNKMEMPRFLNGLVKSMTLSRT
jgi:hypothetical protein